MEEADVDIEPGLEPTDAISVSADGGESLKSSNGSTIQGSVNNLAVPSCETIPPTHSYQIKPVLADKFKAAPVKEIIRSSLSEKLGGKSYDAESVKKWTVEIANEISYKVTELKLKRYKHIVQVTIGEQKGAGVKSGVRCLWDSETDGYTSDIFTNDTIFCLAVVFAVYLY